MFTSGQLTFAAIFLVAFVLVLVFSYKGDKKKSRKYFKNSYLVLLGFLVLMGFMMFLKFYFKK